MSTEKSALPSHSGWFRNQNEATKNGCPVTKTLIGDRVDLVVAEMENRRR